jgi:hypothetical protein
MVSVLPGQAFVGFIDTWSLLQSSEFAFFSWSTAMQTIHANLNQTFISNQVINICDVFLNIDMSLNTISTHFRVARPHISAAEQIEGKVVLFRRAQSSRVNAFGRICIHDRVF